PDDYRDNVPVLHPERPRDPVNDHVIRRGADRGRIATVALEGRLAALSPDELVGEGIELLRGHARVCSLADQSKHVGHDGAGAGHALDLLGGLSDDHLTAACSSACWISPKTSATGRSALTPTRLPRAR